MRLPAVLSELVKGILQVDDALRVRGTDLWLDPPKRKVLAFVSYTHSDHLMRRHNHVILSLNTARFYQRKYPDAEVPALAFEEKQRIGDTTVKLLPAGHILGSVQICMEVEGIRVVYTGDVKLSASFTAERVKIKPCDVLIIGSTYGEPRCVFPRRWAPTRGSPFRTTSTTRNCWSTSSSQSPHGCTPFTARVFAKLLRQQGIAAQHVELKAVQPTLWGYI